MVKVALFALLLLTLNSCMFSGCIKVELPKSKKEWVNKHKVGDQYIYRSNQDRTDTLTVSKLFCKFTPCNKLEVSDYQNEEASVFYNSYLFGKYIYIYFRGINEGSSYFSKYSFINISEDCNRTKLEKHKDKIKINSLKDTINAYTFNLENTEFSNDGIIKSFSWSEKYGIVHYVTNKDEIFELANLSPDAQ